MICTMTLTLKFKATFCLIMWVHMSKKAGMFLSGYIHVGLQTSKNKTQKFYKFLKRDNNYISCLLFDVEHPC